MKPFKQIIVLIFITFYANAQVTKEQAVDSLFNVTGRFDSYKEFLPTVLEEFVKRIPNASMKAKGKTELEKVTASVVEEMRVESRKRFLSKFSETEISKITEVVDKGMLSVFNEKTIGSLYMGGLFAEGNLTSLVEFLSSDLNKKIIFSLTEVSEINDSVFMNKLKRAVNPLLKKYGVK